MKEIYLGISIVLGVILLTLIGDALESILSFIVFGVIGLFFISSLTNYKECRETLTQAKRGNSYE